MSDVSLNYTLHTTDELKRNTTYFVHLLENEGLHDEEVSGSLLALSVIDTDKVIEAKGESCPIVYKMEEGVGLPLATELGDFLDDLIVGSRDYCE